MKLNVLSLFDGISCGQIALERAGIKVNNYFASEVDKYAIQITNKNYPNTIQLGDITKIKHSTLKKLPKINLLIGGSPCQGISNLNKNKNKLVDTKESVLFFEYLRILKWIKKYNNKNVKFLLENVVGNKTSTDEITKLLNVQPLQINSNLLSGQNRKRFYWTNISNIVKPKDKNILLKDILLKNVDEKYFIKEGRLKWLLSENGVRCVSKHYCTIDGEKAQCLTVRSEPSWNCNYVTQSNRIRKLTEIEYERLQTIPDNYTEGISSSQRYKALGNAWTVDVIVHILRNVDKTNLS